MRPLHRALTLLLAAVLLAGCSGPDDELRRVTEQLEAHETAQSNLRSRLGELEEELATATAPRDDPATEALDERIGELETRLADLARRLDDAQVTREDERAETLAALSSLESAISQLRGRIEELSTELTRLDEDVQLLQRRFENHSH